MMMVAREAEGDGRDVMLASERRGRQPGHALRGEVGDLGLGEDGHEGSPAEVVADERAAMS